MLCDPYSDFILGNDSNFAPKACSVFDAWQYTTQGRKQVYTSPVRDLAADQISGWLAQEPCVFQDVKYGPDDNVSVTGGLRCLMGAVPNQCLWPLPFDQATYKNIQETFHLPPWFARVCLNFEFGFSTDRSKSTTGKILSWTSRQWSYAVAVSYSVDDNMTYALIVGDINIGYVKYLQSNLAALNSQAFHPLALLDLLIFREFVEYKGFASACNDRLLGVQDLLREDFDINKTKEKLRDITNLLTSLANIEAQLQRISRLVQQYLPKAMEEFQHLVTGTSDRVVLTTKHKAHEKHLGADRTETWRDMSLLHANIQDRLEQMQEPIIYLSGQLSTWKQRTKYLYSYSEGLSAHLERDATNQLATDSARDSSSLKALAVLTAIYLPPSFVATLLTMPMVGLGTDSFWVYWAVAVPLSIVTTVAWGGYMLYVGWRNETPEQRADGPGASSQARRGVKHNIFQSAFNALMDKRWPSQPSDVETGAEHALKQD